MKTKQGIYFFLIVSGAVIMGAGENWMKKEYALCIGIVLLMFGIYMSSRARATGGPRDEGEKDA
ncbi:MAG TPA: hypothetical protein VKN36_08490 [Eudoraea sp.]|nr:hypothetical protein [Eudoraea sp.]